MQIIDKVKTKMDEYGLEIYDDYPLSNDEHVFYIEEMILFVNTIKESVGISFQASTRPDKAASMMLILNEINSGLDVMEPFVFDRNNRCLTGDKAFELLNKSKQSETIQNFLKDQTYKELLMSEKCHEC